jgi:3-dehydroquinate synthase
MVSYFEDVASLNIAIDDFSKSYSSVFVLTDTNTRSLCLPLLNYTDLNIIEIEAGELNKNINTLTFILEQLSVLKATRHSLLISLGGGMVSDIGGLAASLYMRGVDHLILPTTLLAMVDAAHGGKTGIDFNGVKNMIGTFREKDVVFVCPKFLEMLPEREYIAGLAEVIKHYLIIDKSAFYDFDLKNSNKSTTIQKAIAIKTSFVKKDPLDKNERQALNFGHTIGHAVESLFLTRPNSLLHGEGVAVGIVAESYISYLKESLTIEELTDITGKIKSIFFDLPTIEISDYERLLSFVSQDKKNDVAIQCVLLDGIGGFKIKQEVSPEMILEAIDFYNKAVAV